MSLTELKRTLFLTLILSTAFVVCWELFLRNKGASTAYDDGPPLWAYHRAKVYDPVDESTIFIGSSRVKFDLDIPTWENITGEKAIQLACVGSSPLPQLYNLADDPEFKGKLVVDVTEILFFSESPNAVERPDKAIEYYKEITPAQRTSFVINKPLEASFAFLDKENFSINALLDKVELKSRPGIFMFPIFPSDFGKVYLNRQEYMTERFVADTGLQNQVRNIWKILGSLRDKPPITGAPLDSLFETVKVAVDKIEARGGKVVFVRTPSSGPFLEGENKGYPREKYWDKLLAYTGKPGIHFLDDPATNHYFCPEFSHLSPADAIDYTKHLIRHLDEEVSWNLKSKI